MDNGLAAALREEYRPRSSACQRTKRKRGRKFSFPAPRTQEKDGSLMSPRNYTGPQDRMTSPNWERRLAGTHPRPIVLKRMHRVFWVPGKYVSVAAVLFDERKHTIREIADRTGYSVKGAWDAIQSMVEMAIIAALNTTRGCKGWTRARIAADAQVLNVSPTVDVLRLLFKEERTVEETFARGAPPGLGYEAFKAIGARLWGSAS